MRKIRELLRQKHQGLKHRVMALALNVSASSVSEYLRRARAAGLSWPLPEELDDLKLEEKLFPQQPTSVVFEPPEPRLELSNPGLSVHQTILVRADPSEGPRHDQ